MSRKELLGGIIDELARTIYIEYLPARSLYSNQSVLSKMLGTDITIDNNALNQQAIALAKSHKDVNLPREELIQVNLWVDNNGQYYGSYWGRRNLSYKDHPNFRIPVTFEQAVGQVAPLPENER